MLKKKSFFEKLTGGIKFDDESEFLVDEEPKLMKKNHEVEFKEEVEEEQDGELTIDLYQTNGEIVVQSMIAGVLPENLSIMITRDTLTIKGKRDENRSIKEGDYYVRELYWGSFSRTISLPEEVDPEEAEAIEKHGLLVIKLPKINKHKQTNLKVKSI
ncbi:MAG: Hsp20/alpha crystallin family protein [Candidatus Pacebacteria bacterium]|nr:Hsp20/alpha crystallin family protein [Candidatus Paceibacterota bacterium]MBP9715786.1 Hsp20/alpha crystallin family protein [Candidatus Paceibacterota bacterium]